MFSEIKHFIHNRYFLFGLAIQKGLPILVLPLLLMIFDRQIYAEYVLLYSGVQAAGLVVSLGIPQAVIPFWYECPEVQRSRLTGILLLLLSLAMGVFSLLIIVVYFTIPQIDLPLGLAIILLVFVYFYNLNALALNLLRVKMKQGFFLLATLLSAAIYLAILLGAKVLGLNSLFWLMMIQAGLAGIQCGLYLLFSGSDSWVMPGRQALKDFSSSILRFSVPIAAYSLLMLLVLVLDKWIVNAFFPHAVLAQYVIDFQFAFSVALVSLVIGIYNSQRMAQLVYADDVPTLRQNLLGNYGLTIVGSTIAAAAAFAYAKLGHVQLSISYWILMLAFAANNLFAVNSALLAAQKRSKALAVMAFVSAAVFSVGVLIAGILHHLVWIPILYVTIFAALFCISMFLNIRVILTRSFTTADRRTVSVQAAPASSEIL